MTPYAGLTIEKFSEDHLQNFVFRFRAWFSDDGTFIGLPAQLAELISQLETNGPAYGLFINFEKCKLISVHVGPIAEIPQITKFGSFSDWTSLGVQVGDAAARARDISRVVAKASTKNRRFAAMSGDSHNALTLLRYCGSFNLICFHMRAMGPSPEWATYDLNVRGCVEHVTTGLTSIAWDQVQLPLRDGGCGITSASAHAASACIASILESQALRSCLTQTPFPYDSLLEFCLNDPTLHTFSQAKAYATAQTRVEKLDKNLQKRISTLVSNEQRRKLVASLEVSAASDSGRGLARLASAAHTGASLYLVRPSSVSGILHIQSDKFRALMCMRLGLPLSLEDLPCQLCFKKKADVLGDHVCTCMTSGVRNLAHNELRNTFTALAYTAFMMPKMEVHPFPQAPSLRLDTALRSGFKGKTALLDFAITHSLKPSSLAPSKPGNAANDYVHVKEAMYGGYSNENLHLFVPMVIDSFGCWCDRAKPILGAVAHSYAKRTGTGRLGVLHVFATLNACIMNSVGSILLAGHATVKNRTYRTLPRCLRVADSESSDNYNSAGEEDERPSTGTESSSEDDDDDDDRINGATQEGEDNQTFSASVANPPAYGSASFTTPSSIPAPSFGDASATPASASSTNPVSADYFSEPREDN
ncbi:MAG: hypothetical protein NTV12_06825 [Verrucomicrobia bacterium]|nr:hypothetical protein [Verrucomicrobiota bacterium]